MVRKKHHQTSVSATCSKCGTLVGDSFATQREADLALRRHKCPRKTRSELRAEAAEQTSRASRQPRGRKHGPHEKPWWFSE